MSRLTDLIREAKQRDPQLGADLEQEFRALSTRRAFGLNFERHRPEAVELPRQPVRKGDKVRVLPERGSTTNGDRRLWRVKRIEKVDGVRVGSLELLGSSASPEKQVVAADDLVVVAEFRDLIYPGLVSTGTVLRGGDKPVHGVINGENYHVLKSLTFTHRGTVDAIYIDPPYNTGAKDWKYNNDYVESDDIYRHSKWLAFMERRLLLAKELLNPEGSVMIVTIDEKEYLRLGLLLEQTFPEANIQMVTTAINPKGSPRANAFSRVEEYIFFVAFGETAPIRQGQDMLYTRAKPEQRVEWVGLRRRGSNWQREARPSLFYPIFVEPDTAKLVEVGDPLPLEADRSIVPDRDGLLTVWPLNSRGDESRWQMTPGSLMKLAKQGFVRTSRQESGGVTMDYLSSGQRNQIASGQMAVTGHDANGAVIVEHEGVRLQVAKTMWNMPSHDSTAFGSRHLSTLMPDRRFPFPKSLYAVEDTLRFYVGNKPDAIVLDFFAGSGTTAHAVMRLNQQDEGRRRCILVTNNEVSAEEQTELRKQGVRPGDLEWEQRGICDYITKPRIEAAITGNTPSGEPISGNYQAPDESPIAEGFAENAEFFDLTYENPVSVGHNRAFAGVAPLLWLRAGAQGERISTIPASGWEIVDTYGILFDLDQSAAFCKQVSKTDGLHIVYVVTDDDRRFQSVAQRLPDSVEPVRLYESYLTNFRFTSED